DARLRRPVRFAEEPGKHRAERIRGVEEADAAEAGRVIPGFGQALGQRRSVEDPGVGGGGLAAAEARGERTWVRARGGRRGQEAGEERGVRGEGEAAGSVPFLPARSARGVLRQHAGEVRKA